MSHRPTSLFSCAVALALACSSSAPTVKLRFEPPKADQTDVAVGEEVSYRIRLIGESKVDWDAVRIVSSCDCVTAEVAAAPDEATAEIQVTIHGTKAERIEAHVEARQKASDAKPATGAGPVEPLANHAIDLAITRRPFVTPREVELKQAKDARFELVVGQAFAPDAKLPGSILKDLDVAKLDAKKIELVDMVDDPVARTEDDQIVRTRLVFAVVAVDPKAAFETTIPIEFGEPPVKREVKVRWRGAKPAADGGH